MKKKVLFVMPGLYSGGAEKSLVNLLNLLDYSKLDVDLLLFKKEGYEPSSFRGKYFKYPD